MKKNRELIPQSWQDDGFSMLQPPKYRPFLLSFLLPLFTYET